MKKLTNQTFLVQMLFIFTFAALGCDDANTVKTNGNKAEEITWQQTALDSLNIFTLATNSSGSVFASSCGYGVFRSSDQGTTWISVSLRFCFNSFAIKAEGDMFGVRGCCLRRSTDNGESWDILTVESYAVDLRAIAFNHSGDIFVGSTPSDESGGGIYRSGDNGESWTSTSFPVSMDAKVFAINANGDILAGTSFGVYRSTDNGETWVERNNGFARPDSSFIVSALAINPVTGDLFAAIELDRVYRSTNNGDSWTSTDLTIPIVQSIAINSNGVVFAGNGSFLYNIDPDPEGVFYSKDNGNTWTQINRGLTNLDVLTLAVDSSGFVYAGTRGNGVFRSVKSTLQAE